MRRAENGMKVGRDTIAFAGNIDTLGSTKNPQVASRH